MNSQIYCLPQKFGWNAIQGFSKERADEIERYLTQKGKSPYFIIKFNGPDPSPDIREEVERRIPKRRFPSSDAEIIVRDFLWSTECHTQYKFPSVPPSYTPLPPVTYEKLADPPAIRRLYYRPMEVIKPPRGTVVNDPERGLYEWRELAHRPGFGIWQPLERIPVLSNVGERNTLLAPRLKRHAPNDEKEKWDHIRNLSRHNQVAYGYRKETPGYDGHKQTVEHVMSDVRAQPQNPVYLSATHDLSGIFPPEMYMPTTERIRHRDSGNKTRIVTLANPNNPFTEDTRLVGPPPYEKWAA
ncbi:uncharacterized protein LOC106068304 [Biomphalaria glabrata]|uniref:Uncharacterized protein LOC106068304 n=1 Tax=Biomphalaria glabrata TaxID=6526 RepID=A0A9W3AVZ2_BIOGL|nr:uncharacterized protein LOC106068304 [Biomphalaria glabrata]